MEKKHHMTSLAHGLNFKILLFTTIYIINLLKYRMEQETDFSSQSYMNDSMQSILNFSSSSLIILLFIFFCSFKIKVGLCLYQELYFL